MNIYDENIKFLLKNMYWLNNTGKKNAINRAKNIKNILDKFEYSKAKIDNQEFPLYDFTGALQCYILGFYSDCITRTTQSVEMGLIFRLTADLSEEKKREYSRTYQGRFMFGTLKKIGLCENIISEAYNDDFERIIDIRNTHIHGINTLSALIITNKENFDEIKSILEVYNHPKNIAQKIIKKEIDMLTKSLKLRSLDEAVNATNILSNYQWCANTEFEEEIKEKSKNYINNIKNKKPVELIKSFLTNRELFSPDWYHKEVSEEALNLSYKLLGILKIINF